MSGKGQRTSGFASSSLVTETALFLTVAVAAWYLTILRYRFNAEFPLASLQGLIDGTAYRPFQYRMLVPWIVSALHGPTSLPIQTLYRGVDAAATMGICYAFRYYLVPWSTRRGAAVLSLAIFWVLPWNYLLPRDIPIILPYDMASIAILTLAMALIHRRRWILYYPLLIAGTMNREATIFLVVAFALTQWGSLPRKTLALHLAAQLVLWLAVKIVMQSLYAGNPGVNLEFYHADTHNPHFLTNLDLLSSWPTLIAVLSSFGFIWVLIPLYRRQIDDQFLRRALWVVPPFLATILLFGNVNEMRVYGELLPFLLAPSLVILSRLLTGANGSE